MVERVLAVRPRGGDVTVVTGGRDGTHGGFAKVSYVGNGFMMIPRETLTRVAEAHPELTADLSDIEPGLNHVAMVFDTMIEPETGQHLLVGGGLGRCPLTREPFERRKPFRQFVGIA